MGNRALASSVFALRRVNNGHFREVKAVVSTWPLASRAGLIAAHDAIFKLNGQVFELGVARFLDALKFDFGNRFAI